MSAKEKIEAQQMGKENDPAWMVGEQLKDILRNEPELEQILSEDLDSENMSLEKGAGAIKAWADKQPRKGHCVCVPPNRAEAIIREFYGLPEAGSKTAPAVPESTGFMSLADFL